MNNVYELNRNEVYDDIETFLEDLKHGSDKTHQRYKASIELFFNWTEDNRYTSGDVYFLTPIDITNIEYTTMQKFRTFLKDERRYANSSTNNTMTAIYSLFTHLKKVKKNKYKIQPDELRLKSLSLTDENHHGDIDWEESDKMIEYVSGLPNKKLPKVKAALIHTARMTGIRLNGLLGLDYTDLRREGGMWVLHHAIKGKKHAQAIRDDLAEMLLDLRKDENDKNEKVFKLSSKTVERMMKEINEAIGIDESRQVVFHSIRRLYGGETYAASGNDIMKVKDYLGHSSIDTSRGYVERSQNLKDSPALYIGLDMDESMVDHLSADDWKKLFKEMSRGSQYEIINKMKEMGMSHS
ncbi:integrase [Virgibacillus halotolerans]|uniref:tyrosine-type recombinase/integrase n=1 Tax=Virgibacillus halotolerans TaxID=1071053 RepID=UPI00196184BE|nr:tyrosine-type recombinase/integrase [Virgibacillus halotolerans]MBM7598115.1 integrase [Virgibacillus halotolerans]